MPAVGGNEGFGQVLEVGEEVTQFVPGDGVVLAETGLGVCKCFLDLASHLDLRVFPRLRILPRSMITLANIL